MKRKFISHSTSSSSLSSDEGLYYIRKSYNNNPNKKLRKNKSSSSSIEENESLKIKENKEEDEKEYKIDKNKKPLHNKLNDLYKKLEQSKTKLEKIFDVNDNLIEIEEIKKSKNIPRADGIYYKNPELIRKRTEERYGKEWIKSITDKQHILEKNPSYRFLEMIAGKIETNVPSLIDNETLDSVIQYNNQLLKRLEKERDRTIVSSKIKQEQIEILEKELEKSKLEFNKIQFTIQNNIKILNIGNFLIDTGKNKSIPESLYDQGILYILKLEDDFNPISEILRIFFQKKSTQSERNYKEFQDKMKLIRENTKKISKELFNKENIIIDLDKEKDKESFEFFHYSYLLLFKYYLNLNQKSPKLRLQKRFKYLINQIDLNNNDFESLNQKLNEDFNSINDKQILEDKYEDLLNKYKFNDIESQNFNLIINGYPNLILLIDNELKLNEFDQNEKLKTIFNINWEFYDNNPLINLTNFVILFIPLFKNKKLIKINELDITINKETKEEKKINKVDQIHDVLINLAYGGAKTDKDKYIIKNILTPIIIDRNSNDANNNKILLYFIETERQFIYNIFMRNYSDKIIEISYILLSNFIFDFFMNYPNPIQMLTIKLYNKMNIMNQSIQYFIEDPIYNFFNYYNLESGKTIDYLSFIIDRQTIKLMKEFYFISLNEYFYDIIKIFFDNHIIEFNNDIENLIEKNTFNNKDLLEIFNIKSTNNNNNSNKIDASFYKLLNEYLTKIDIKILDKSFISFLLSFTKENIEKNKLKIENKGYGKNKNELNNLSILPTESLNFENQYKGDYPIINIHLYFYLYNEYLKKIKDRIKKSITKIENSINDSKNKISDISSEKVNRFKIEEEFKETYQNPAQWILNPLNSGIIIVRNEISAAIQHSLSIIRNNCPNLKDLTLPIIILSFESDLTIRFATLVSFIITQQRITTPTQYFKDLQIKNNQTNVQREIFYIKDCYSFQKSSSYNNSHFLGTIYFNNKYDAALTRSFKIYLPKNESINNNNKRITNIAVF